MSHEERRDPREPERACSHRPLLAGRVLALATVGVGFALGA